MAALDPTECFRLVNNGVYLHVYLYIIMWCILLLFNYNYDSLVLVVVFAELDTSKGDQLTVADLSTKPVGRILLDLRMVFVTHKHSGSSFAGHKDVVVLTYMLVLT